MTVTVPPHIAGYMNGSEHRFIPSKEKAKALMILLPCMGGNILAYRYPYSLWSKLGYNMFLFNPPGHGKSDGIFSFEESFRLLKEGIDRLDKERGKLPLIGIGHSGGGSGILKFFSQYPEYEISGIFLLSPILDTAESLHFLYQNSNINEFINSLKIKNVRIREVLGTNRWLDENVWDNEGLKEKLNAWASASGEIYADLGTFLENIFIPSRKFHQYMKQSSDRTVLFLPKQDIWYPMNDSIDAVERFGIRKRVIQTAENHFFRNGWQDVGKEITSFLES